MVVKISATASLRACVARGLAFVAAEIIHDDDVARWEGGGRHVGDIDLETPAVDGTRRSPRVHRSGRVGALPERLWCSSGRTGHGRSGAHRMGSSPAAAPCWF